MDGMRPVNETVSSSESLKPHTTDVVAAMGKEPMASYPNTPFKGKRFLVGNEGMEKKAAKVKTAV